MSEDYSTESKPSNKLWGAAYEDVTSSKANMLAHESISTSQFITINIEVSKAYNESLFEAKYINEEEFELIKKAYDEILDEWEKKDFKIKDEDEDVYTMHERLLVEKLGELGYKANLGRSRSEASITNLKIWLKRRISVLLDHLKALLKCIIERAEDDSDVIMPGYKHLQPVQPIRFSHWLLKFGYDLKLDIERLNQLKFRVEPFPLNSSSVAGPFIQLDFNKLAEKLGFEKVAENALFGVENRDFVMEFLFWSSLMGSHLAKFADELSIFNSKEFGFVQLHKVHQFGSSSLPNLRRGEALEAVKAKSGILFGKLCSYMMIMKGIRLGYSKELNEDQTSLIESFDILLKCIPLIKETIELLSIDPMSMTNKLNEEQLSSDLSYYLVKKGVPYRLANFQVNQLLTFSIDSEVSLLNIDLEDFKKVNPLFEEDVFEFLKKDNDSYEASVERHNQVGGTSLDSVMTQIKSLKEWLNQK